MSLKTRIHKLSLRTRLTILFVFIYGSTTILFSLSSYFILTRSLLKDFDNALYNYAIDIAQTIEIGPKNDLNFPPLKVDEGKIFPFPAGTALILVRHISGKILVRSGEFGDFDPPYKSDIEKILKGRDSAFRTVENIDDIPDAEAGSYRVVTFPLDSETKPILFLQIAVPLVSFESQFTLHKSIMMFGLPAVLAVAVLAGLWVASRALRPVQEIINKTKQIGATDLHERVPLPETEDEIKTLAETLNQMLERIEKSFESQERFVADASHQLLTPLTILKGEIEVYQKSIIDENQTKYFKSLMQEVDNLAKIVKDMLLLARIDSGQGILKISEIYIDEILIDVISRIQKLANSKNIQIKFDFAHQENRCTLRGDADLLIHLFTNLIENAVKYSFQNSHIQIRLSWFVDHTLIEVEDDGIGISSDLAPHIFKRFSRGDSSSKNTKGFGLGLAISQKIAGLHGTQIEIHEKPGQGSIFAIAFTHNAAKTL